MNILATQFKQLLKMVNDSTFQNLVEKSLLMNLLDMYQVQLI